jgi:hypothetical protein
MADPKHVEMLKQGVEAWNAWVAFGHGRLSRTRGTLGPCHFSWAVFAAAKGATGLAMLGVQPSAYEGAHDALKFVSVGTLVQ